MQVAFIFIKHNLVALRRFRERINLTASLLKTFQRVAFKNLIADLKITKKVFKLSVVKAAPQRHISAKVDNPGLLLRWL